MKALEEHYGPSVRSGKSKGHSYRSRRYHQTQKVDNQFAKRKRVYDIVEAEGIDGVKRLQGLIAAQYGSAAASNEEQIRWLFTKLKEDDPRHEALKRRAQEGIAKKNSSC